MQQRRFQFSRASQRDVVYLGALVQVSQMGGGGLRVAGLSEWVQLCTWGPNKLWTSNSIVNLCFYWPHDQKYSKCLPWPENAIPERIRLTKFIWVSVYNGTDLCSQIASISRNRESRSASAPLQHPTPEQVHALFSEIQKYLFLLPEVVTSHTYSSHNPPSCVTLEDRP